MFTSLVVKSFTWLRDLFSEGFEVPNALLEILSDLVDGLYGLIVEALSAVLRRIQLLEARLSAEHVLSRPKRTSIYPTELAIPAP